MKFLSDWWVSIMNSMFTVIKFTFLNKFRSKSFLITTLIIALLMSVLIYLPSIIDSFSSDAPKKIGVTLTDSPVPSKLQSLFKQKKDPSIEIVLLEDKGSAGANEAEAKKQISAGKIKGYLLLKENGASGFPKAVYQSEDNLPGRTKDTLQTALLQVKQELAIEDAKLTQEQLDRLFSPVSLKSEQISLSSGGDSTDKGKSESEMTMAYALVYVLLMLIYMGVLGFGNMVAMEITTEKNSRVMELLISSVSPLKQMFGKIIGICLLGLLQITVFITVGGINLYLSDNADLLKDLNIDLNDLPIGLLSYFLIFYLLGYFIYATLFAAIGSLVSRTEEVGQAIMPVTFLVIAAFMVAMFGLQTPNSTFIVVMSYVPFFSPLTMFLRIGLSDPAAWEIWLSIAISFASIIGLGWIAAKIYRTGVLLYGKRPSFKELRKAMRSYRV